MLNDFTDGLMTTPVRLTRLYVATLLGLALLLTGAEVITQWQIDKFQDELSLIRYTARQRHVSQQIAKKALLMADERDSVTFIGLRDELGTLFRDLERNHLDSRRGYFPRPDGTVADHSIPNSDTAQRLYGQVRPHFEALQTSVRQLLTVSGPTQVRGAPARASLKLLLDNESPFLAKIDAVVLQYTVELRQKLNRLQRLELYLHMLTLATIGAIAWFIIRPAVARLDQTLSKLIVADKQSTETNRKLRSLNKSLKKARQQLYEASQRQLQEQADEQKTRTAYLIAGQEEERKRLSRELHDGLGQLLTAIKLQVDGLEAKLARGQADGVNLTPLKNLIAQTIQETRSVSNNLMPSVLSDFGVLAALRMLADTHNRADTLAAGAVKVDVDVSESLESTPLNLSQDAEITLYRVAQEAMTNAIRHGKAQRISLRLFERDGQLVFTIEDNGVGFKTQRLNTEPHGQGVHNMHERINLLGGTFALSSTPGKGTTIQVSIPYHSSVIAHDYDQINVG